mmetsp:Transcript_26349/g.72759  ORF Transcript_26349/g.72759 Transcript_26349/m.72759 type:complete len:91 (+) Transcript_26349:2677-2949(+)
MLRCAMVDCVDEVDSINQRGDFLLSRRATSLCRLCGRSTATENMVSIETTNVLEEGMAFGALAQSNVGFEIESTMTELFAKKHVSLDFFF